MKSILDKQYLENLFNYSNVPIIIWDRAHIITRFNTAFEKLIGRKEEDVVGKSIELLFPESLMNATMQHIKSTETGFHLIDTEIKIIHQNGFINTVIWNSAPIWGVDEKTLIATIAQGQDITFSGIPKLKETEAALNQSERNMNSFVNDSLLCIYFFNTETKKIIYANPFFCQLLGYTPEEIETLKIYDFLNHSKESVDSFVNHVIETKQRNIGERQWKKKNGKVIDMFVNASYGDHANSKIIYISAQDISERKRADKLLVESEARLKRGELVAKFGNWKLDLQQQQMYSSEGSRKIYGVDKNELSFGVVKKFPLPEYRQKLDDTLTALIAEGKPYDLEFKIKRANDGSLVDVHSIAEYDPTTKTVFGVLQDITDRKKAQLEVIESEKKFRSVIQTAKDSIVLANEIGEIIFWNHFAEKIFGYKKNEILGKPFSFIIPGRHSAEHLKKFEQHVSTNQTMVKDKIIELYGLKKNGTEFPVELSLSNWTNGNEKFYCGIIRDITERKNAEEEQNAYIKKLSEIAFLQSHQVRSPIASLLGLISLFNFDNPTDPMNSEVLSRVKIVAKKLDDVIQEIVKKTSSIEQNTGKERHVEKN